MDGLVEGFCATLMSIVFPGCLSSFQGFRKGWWAERNPEISMSRYKMSEKTLGDESWCIFVEVLVGGGWVRFFGGGGALSWRCSCLEAMVRTCRGGGRGKQLLEVCTRSLVQVLTILTFSAHFQRRAVSSLVSYSFEMLGLLYPQSRLI